MNARPWIAGAGLALMLCAAPAGSQAPASAPMAPRTTGYLSLSEIPDSVKLLPPPPAPGSAAEARDVEVSKAALALRGGPRWDLATQDADLSFPAAPATFSCAIGAPISPTETPRLYELMRRAYPDIGLSTRAAKVKYQRARPFAVNGQPMCTPAFDAVLRKDGSYPSGHAAVGWGWGLILAAVAPDRADAILARGRAFAQSRAVCNVHWQIDVDEGRTMGSASVARLQASPEFRADVEAARAEIAAVRAKGLKPNRDCAEEAARLAAG